MTAIYEVDSQGFLAEVAGMGIQAIEKADTILLIAFPMDKIEAVDLAMGLPKRPEWLKVHEVVKTLGP